MRCFGSDNWDPRGLYSLSPALLRSPLLHSPSLSIPASTSSYFPPCLFLCLTSIHPSCRLSISFLSLSLCHCYHLSSYSSLSSLDWHFTSRWIEFGAFTRDDKLWQLLRCSCRRKSSIWFWMLPCVKAHQPQCFSIHQHPHRAIFKCRASGNKRNVFPPRLPVFPLVLYLP